MDEFPAMKKLYEECQASDEPPAVFIPAEPKQGKPLGWQRAALNSAANCLAIWGPIGSGKSWVAARVLVREALAAPERVVVAVRETTEAAVLTVGQEIRAALGEVAGLPALSWEERGSRLTLPNESRIYCLGLDQILALNAGLVWLDEPGGLPDPAWGVTRARNRLRHHAGPFRLLVTGEGDAFDAVTDAMPMGSDCFLTGGSA